ncbi:hypothetical protein KC19_8G192100 [Ceratodon purpureus]|uniref:Phospholipid-transporting ATPase n=1 Tax=Ceratodon purpureus TaxID=3225 RepID=A0A8T0H8R8_CERPU|nr:hypothetical protein KC19_8G192100 [Ceratodon purpureus]
MTRWTNFLRGKGWRFRPIQDETTSMEDAYIVHCNRSDLNTQYGYLTNRTSTTKYSLWNFLPRSLFEQYRRAAYWYFTAMAVLTLSPFSPYNPISVWLPLIFVLSLGIGRELWEDLRRGRGDREVNNRPILVHSSDGRLEEKKWKLLCVGDVVKVMDGDYFPADLLLLSSTGPEGVCYVETMNLDGETNLKVRHALECTWTVGARDDKVLGGFEATVRCEGPNASLYTFSGLMELPDGQSYPLGPPQILLRDSSLQNTGSIYGVVLYTGHDTKVMRNSTPPPSKRSRVDKTLDKLIYAMFATLLTLCIITGIVLGVRTKREGTDVWYLQPLAYGNLFFNPERAYVAGVVSSVSGLILYGYLIPISLYVSLEVVRVLQALFMMLDIQMYDSATNKRFRVKSAGLNEELGQVDTILSDKTGTLTCNQMDFFRCSIAGISYGKGMTEVEISAARLRLPLGEGIHGPPDMEEGSPSSDIHRTFTDTDSESSVRASEVEGPSHNHYKEKGFNFYDSRILGGNWVGEERRDGIQFFFRILALCHTAIPEGSPESPSSMRYRAESPDEAALVVAAKQFGFFFYKRTPTTLHVRETHGPGAEPVDVKYQLLNVLEFSSARKRMSVIVRFPDGKILLLSKGADSVMLQRLDPQNRGYATQTTKHLQEYGEVGLRTLLLAYKVLKEEEYQAWQVRFTEARAVLGRERDIRTEDVAEEIEQGLSIVGGTGVEDKLQAGVPEAIDRLARAGLKIWVLTGDKVETAINIGYACSLLRPGMENLVVTLECDEARAIEENAQRSHLSPDDTLKALKNLVAQNIKDALHLVLMTSANPRMTETDELKAKSSISFTGTLSRSQSRNSGHMSRSPSKNNPLSRNSSNGLQMTQLSPIIQTGHGRKRSESETLAFQLENAGISSGLPPLGHGHKRSASDTLAFQLENAGVCRKSEDVKGAKNLSSGPQVEHALIIDGQSLAFILAETDLQEQFLRVCINCASVLCCRVSPMQKAQVTNLVRKGLGHRRLCLAIGDGANDVGMIQAANVGVGITGVEGAQAAMVADYAIGQFRFLERLLLVHGHWCYRRISLMILYFFYKVCILGWISFYSNIVAHFSGQPLYNDWYASFYNTLFTAFPIMVVAVIDQDVSAAQAIKFPELYRAGQRGEFFNAKTISWWLLNSWYCSIIIFFFPILVLGLGAFRSDGQVAARQDFGQAMFTGLILVPNLQLFCALQYFTWIHHVAIWGSICTWYIFVIVFGSLPPKWSSVAYMEFVEVLAPAVSYWLLQFLVVVAALLPSFACRSYLWMFQPTDYELVLESEKPGAQTAEESRP